MTNDSFSGNELLPDNAASAVFLTPIATFSAVSLQADRDALNKRLGKHDIGNLAENKPGLVEKIINKASDSAARCMEIASGSPLTEEELNGTPNRECPSFWPDSNTTE